MKRFIGCSVLLLFLVSCTVYLLPTYIYFLEIPAKKKLSIKLTSSDKFETIIENKSEKDLKVKIEKDSLILEGKTKKTFMNSLDKEGLIIFNTHDVDALVRVRIKKLKGGVDQKILPIE